MVQINILSIKQVPPITAATAQVLINFQVLGVLPDIVQIFARGPGDEKAQLVDTVHIGSPDHELSSVVQLQAGTEYVFNVCPRTTTGGALDDLIDGEPWDTFCSSLFSFTTQGVQPPPANNRPTPPTINSFQPLPATLNTDGHIVISWSEPSADVDKYHVIWGPEGGGSDEFEISDTKFSAGPTRPGVTYTFKVQACISKLIGDDWCSDFTQPKSYTMPSATNSLRKFLTASGVDLSHVVSIRSLNTAHVAGLRALMRM